jgi:hypothetical protein
MKSIRKTKIERGAKPHKEREKKNEQRQRRKPGKKAV